MVRKGEITEIVGRPSSGRTSLFVNCLREVTRDGGVVALVDTDETFDPVSAAEAGVDLSRLLWVRCVSCPELALRATDLLIRCPGLALIGLDLGERPVQIPLAMAFRLKLAARRTGVALVILSSQRIAGPGASLAVRTVRNSLEWSGPGAAPTRLARVSTEVQVLRAAPHPPASPQATVGIAWWEV